MMFLIVLNPRTYMILTSHQNRFSDEPHPPDNRFAYMKIYRNAFTKSCPIHSQDNQDQFERAPPIPNKQTDSTNRMVTADLIKLTSVSGDSDVLNLAAQNVNGKRLTSGSDTNDFFSSGSSAI